MKSPLQAMRDLLIEDTRYKIEAYQFIREALQHAHEQIERGEILGADGEREVPLAAEVTDELEEPAFEAAEFDTSDFDTGDTGDTGDNPFEEGDFEGHDFQTTPPSAQHITGQQLCEACRLYAVDQYGYLARIVLNSWGIHATRDMGELVYNLIRIDQMRKNESDQLEDFDGVYDFDNAFAPQFEMSLEKGV